MSTVAWSTKIKDIPLERFAGQSVRWAGAVQSRAVRNAPVLTGALRRSGHINQSADKSSIEVEFGGPSTPKEVRYARLRHYVNNKNPQTRYYLQKAAEQQVRLEDYFL